MKRIIYIILVALLCLQLSSCLYEQRDTSSSKTSAQQSEKKPVTNQNNDSSFQTVSDLLQAIKHDPYKYHNKKICVKGFLIKQKDNGILALVDLSDNTEDASELDGFLGRYHYRQSPCIDIIIPDEILSTVACSGDYLTVYGTVKISDGNIYLDNCTYSYE